MSEMSRDEAELNRLICKAQEGDSEAFTELYTSFLPLILSMAKQYAVEGEDEQDFRQEGTLAFYRALLSYRISPESAGFPYYAKLCVSRHLLDCRKKVQSQPQVEEAEEAEVIADDTQDPSRNVLEKETYRNLCEKIERVLSPEENRVWMLHFSGYTAGEIAQTLRKDRKSVENALFRVRKKLRKTFGA